MFDPNERLAFRRLFFSERKTNRQSLQLACIYTMQVLVSGSILLAGYRWFHGKGVLWAMVSAILVLQPGLEQSIAASAVRIAANTVGGLIGFTIGETFGTAPPQLLFALAATVFVAEFLRLDVGLRTACVATLIVMTTSEGHVITSSFERFSAVLIGCLLAVAVQFGAEGVRRWFGWKDPEPRPIGAASSTTVTEHGE